MTMEQQSKALTSASVSGYKVLTSAVTDAPASATNGIASISLSQSTYPLVGKKFIAGMDVSVGGTAPAAGTAASTTLTFDNAIDDTTLASNPYIELTDAAGLTRTYWGISSGTSATATFDFNKAAALNDYITLQSYFDGATTSVNFKAAAQGTVAGATSGAYTLFAKDDADTSGDATSAYDAATNLAAAINSATGLPYLEAFANQTSDIDTTLVNGRVFIKQTDVGTGGHTAISSSATAATCTITITDFTELNSTDKVNLIATDGTNYDFVNGSQSSVSGTWESATSDEVTATNLMNVINTSSGPAGTRFTATVDGAVVTATQATTGSAGNTTVTLTDTGTAGMSKTDFVGGTKFTDSTVSTLPAAFTGGTAEVIDVTKNQWGREGSAEHAAESLKDAINSAYGHGYSTTTGGFTAVRTVGALVITSDVVGTTLNDSGVAYNKEFQNVCSVPPNNFSGGAAVVNPTLEIQGSVDGTNWSKLETITTVTDLNTTGMKQGIVDLTAYAAVPYLRMAFNPEESTIGTSVKMAFKFVSA